MDKIEPYDIDDLYKRLDNFVKEIEEMHEESVKKTKKKELKKQIDDSWNRAMKGL